MDIGMYLAIWRRRWLLIVAAALLGLGSAMAISALTQPLYVASARMFVSTTGGASVVEAYQGNLFGQERVLSYAKLAAGRQVAQRTIDALHINMTAEQLMSEVTAERVPTETVLLDISVANPNPDVARDLANTVAQQTNQLVEELETSARGGTPAATATLVDAAVTPSHAAVPNWFRNGLVGLVGGLVIGLIGAIARDKADRTIRSPGDAAAAANSRPLGSVPPLPEGKASPIPFSGSESLDGEAFRSLRMNVQAGENGNQRDVIVVAEPNGHADAAQLALGLAAAFAESGRSVLVIDGDLRKREASTRLGLGEAPGLAEVLAGSVYMDDAVAGTEFERMKVLPAGGSQQTPGELLAGPEMAQLVKHVRGEYDVVVVCSAPILPYSDAVVIAGSADGVLLVAHAGTTKAPDLASAAAKVRTADLQSLGVVVMNQKRATHAVL